jgi:hypothetical protein
VLGSLFLMSRARDHCAKKETGAATTNLSRFGLVLCGYENVNTQIGRDESALKRNVSAAKMSLGKFALFCKVAGKKRDTENIGRFRVSLPDFSTLKNINLFYGKPCTA